MKKIIAVFVLALFCALTACAQGGAETTPGGTGNTPTGGIMKITVGDRELTATLAQNSSTEALKELLKAGPLTIEMHDYGNMEKVGGLGKSLPTNDERITTEAGDLILYQGNALVIYLNFFRFNTPQLAAENWGCGGFVPPHTQRFQGEIFNTPELAPGILYYAPNTWTFTRLGKITGVTGEELKTILGNGNVTVTLSL